MNDSRSIEVKSGLKTYFNALREVAAHLYPRLKFLRLAYERVMGAKILPSSVRSVLFICKGNVCRSPLADVYFAETVRKHGHAIAVKSAGIETTPGKPAHALAKRVAAQHGFSLERHATTPLFQGLMQQSDLVFVMEVAQKDRVVRLYPQERHKVFVLGQFCKGGSLDIDDPYSGTQEDFKVCFKRIRESCDRVIEEILAQQKNQEAAMNAPQKSGVQAG